MQLGTYCLIEAHSKCPIPARCTCPCHRPAPAVKPPPKRHRPLGLAKAIVVTNAAGQRICPVCRTTVLVKKNPHGPGRYPNACETCR